MRSSFGLCENVISVLFMKQAEDTPSLYATHLRSKGATGSRRTEQPPTYKATELLCCNGMGHEFPHCRLNCAALERLFHHLSMCAVGLICPEWSRWRVQWSCHGITQQWFRRRVTWIVVCSHLDTLPSLRCTITHSHRLTTLPRSRDNTARHLVEKSLKGHWILRSNSAVLGDPRITTSFFAATQNSSLSALEHAHHAFLSFIYSLQDSRQEPSITACLWGRD